MFAFHSDDLFYVLVCVQQILYVILHIFYLQLRTFHTFLKSRRVSNIKFTFSFLRIVENWISIHAVNIITLCGQVIKPWD
jgi:hypothetical protein